MSYLEECHIIIQECEFNDLQKWPPQQGTSPSQATASQQTTVNAILPFIVILNKTAEQFYEKLNLSLLSGEYVDTVKAIKEIELIRTTLNTLPSTMDHQALLTIKDTLDYNLFAGFIKPISNSLRAYHKLINQLSRKILNDEAQILFEAETINEVVKFGIGTIQAATVNYERLFDLNLKVANIDHNLSIDKKLFSELLIYKRELEGSFQIDPYYKKIIIDKCHFLIKKIDYRFKEDKKNYTYALDFKDIKIESEKIDLTYFKEFDQKTINSYNIQGKSHSSREWTEIYEKIIVKKSISFLEYHTALQFYKDVSKDHFRVKKLREEFESNCESFLQKENVFQFDKYSLAVCINYFFNNELSILLSNKEIDFDEGRKFLSRIKSFQKETLIFNYFPYIKFCEFTLRKIESLLSKQELNLQEFDLLSSSLEEALEHAYKNLDWCKERNFISFQLPYKECTKEIDVDSNKVNVFVASSFILPINYEKIGRDLKDFTKQLDNFKQIYKVHQSIQTEKEAIRQIRVDIEKVDKRAIEIIGVFAAIVLFASGSIQIFNIDGTTFKDGLRWMLAFAYSLVLFVFLIWLITRNELKSISKIHWIFFFGLALVWVISLMSIFDWGPFSD